MEITKRPQSVLAALAAAALTAGALTAVAASAEAEPAAGPVVTTRSGAVRGTVADGLRSFQGIPYAAPPVGGARWRAPAPAASWTGVRDATEPGGPCAQPLGYPIGVPTDNEDCLYLNVTAPAAAKGPLPVLVWIHGGSLMYGTGDMYGPERLAAQGAVVISMNYRLGVMGFLTDDALPGADGLGIQDQQAALRWVRANAAAFGGDAGKVTIMGQSGGGYAVCDHLASPASAGLFDRAIVQSAPCAGGGGSRTRAEAAADARRVIEAVGCATDTAACLRATPAARLLEAYGPYNEPRPVAGTGLLPVAPEKALRTGAFHRVPVLIGVNSGEERGRVLGEELADGNRPTSPERYARAVREEFGDRAGAILARYPLADFPSPGEALAAVGTDASWSVPTLDTARLLARYTPTRMYEFAETDTPWFAGYPAPNFAPRAQHMAELAYLFGMDLFAGLDADQDRFADRLAATWVRFAATGDPGWTRFRGGADGHVQSLTDGRWTRADFAAEHRYGFWKGLR